MVLMTEALGQLTFRGALPSIWGPVSWTPIHPKLDHKACPLLLTI